MPDSSVLKQTLEITLTGPFDRLDVALLTALKAQKDGSFSMLSRAQLKTWFQEKRIRETAPHSRLAQASDALEDGGSVRLEVRFRGEEVAPALDGLRSRDLQLPVLFEDEALLIVHKRSGVPSVAQASDESETAVGFALAHCPKIFGVGVGGNEGRSVLESGILHRLDTGTSGVLVFAKTEEAFQRLREAWKKGEVRKKYRARVRVHSGFDWEVVPREIRYDLAHDPKSKKRMIALVDDESDEDGNIRPRENGFKKEIRGKAQAAVTLIHQITPLPGNVRGMTDADLEIEIQTGVMHQIRCHLAAVGAAILGDPIYGQEPASRMFLHAWRLSLPHPLNADLRIDVEAEIPWAKTTD